MKDHEPSEAYAAEYLGKARSFHKLVTEFREAAIKN